MQLMMGCLRRTAVAISSTCTHPDSERFRPRSRRERRQKTLRKESVECDGPQPVDSARKQ